MAILMYALACALGLALGWFGYDFTKAVWMAVRAGRRTHARADRPGSDARDRERA